MGIQGPTYCSATAIYGEESTNPKRNVPRATYLAVGIITGLFAFTSWAMVSGLGSRRGGTDGGVVRC